MAVPVVGVGGAQSRGEQVAAALARVATGVTTVVVPDCGHFVPEERPDVLVDLIRTAARPHR